MKTSSCIYLISPFPVFNPERIPVFDRFNKKNSLTLYKALIGNHRENFISLPNNKDIVYCFDKSDEGFVPEIFNEKSTVQFCECGDENTSLKLLADKFFNNFANNLLVFGFSIGFTSREINRAFDLLSMNDEAVVLGKCISDSVAFFGFNTFNQDIFDSIKCAGGSFDKILSKVNKYENFIHVVGNYQFIKDMEDFKKLYGELSKKESLAYCNQDMHEQFTHLFIEYKEFLK